jgi:chromate transporter
LEANVVNIFFILGTYMILQFTKISSPAIIAGGIILGIIYNQIWI